MSILSLKTKIKLAQKAASIVQDGSSVILGAGIPTKCLKFLNDKDCWVIFETGVIGACTYSKRQEHLIDASRKNWVA